ncbi:MAG: tyrosine-type recombinase/integrase, partial [Raoultibacter sp.]
QPNLTIHELRHTYLSMMAMAGVHPKVMQELAGHASSQTTMDIYSHVNMSAKKAASNVFTDFIKA